MMRKKLLGIAAVLSAIIIAAGVAMAADNQATVGASATIDAVTSLGVGIKAIADDSNQGELNFGSVTDTYQLAQDYLEVNAQSNYGTWKIDIYTDNWASAPSTTTWGYQYGGLVDKSNEVRLPLGWAAFPSKPDDISTEILGDPGEETENGGAANRWTYLKDKWDVDDPETDSGSWSGAQADGYAVVAFGGPGYASVTNPYVEGGDELNEMPFYLYLETAADGAPGTYDGTIGLDLYHE